MFLLIANARQLHFQQVHQNAGFIYFFIKVPNYLKYYILS